MGGEGAVGSIEEMVPLVEDVAERQHALFAAAQRDLLPRLKERREYIESLITVARVYLSSPEFKRILDDDSRLEIARRIEDASRCEDAEVAGIFSIVRAFSHTKGGQVEKAQKLMDKYNITRIQAAVIDDDPTREWVTVGRSNWKRNVFWWFPRARQKEVRRSTRCLRSPSGNLAMTKRQPN